MELFRPTRGGGARARFAPTEASLLRDLVGQVMALVAPDAPDRPVPPPAADVADLEALLGQPGPDGLAPPPETPEDPVLARLLPDGYRDDPEAAGEFRKYTESALRSAKREAARQLLDTLPAAGGRIQLTNEQAQAWLKALNDIRLALGVRLDVTEEYEDQWARLAADDPRRAAYEVYTWLGAVQESLVQALS
jgi:Domain of unknown function (DUF2017)